MKGKKHTSASSASMSAGVCVTEMTSVRRRFLFIDKNSLTVSVTRGGRRLKFS